MDARRDAAEKLAGLQPWQRHTASPTFNYQSCRFCKRTIGSAAEVARNPNGAVAGLWKYEVRHYACDECRDRIIAPREGRP